MSNSDFLDLLDSPYTEAEIAAQSPVVILASDQIDPRYTRTSYSSSSLLHKCPRKYQLKCLNTSKTEDKATNVTFAFGSALGVGIAEYFLHRDKTKAIFAAFLEWDVEFLDENPKQKKSFAFLVQAINILGSALEDGDMSEYEVASWHGKPAIELSFRLTLPGELADHTYRGFMDIVLRNIMTGELVVLEIKSNSGTWVNHYQYKNSAQALGYSVVLDKIAPDSSAYEVLYKIYMTKLERYEEFEFPKTMHQRALWLRDRMWDVQTVERLVQQEGNYGIWPMQGSACVDFGRPCEYMDLCQLDTESLMKQLRECDMIEDTEYSFEIPLEELL